MEEDFDEVVCDVWTEPGRDEVDLLDRARWLCTYTRLTMPTSSVIALLVATLPFATSSKGGWIA